MRWAGKRLTPLTLVVGVLGLLLVGAELGLRFVYPGGVEGSSDPESRWPWMIDDAVLGFKNQAHYSDASVAINDVNLRNPSIARTKPKDTVRLICLGDSRTFGVWLDLGKVRYDNEYPRMLGELLSTDPGLPGFEVVNAGVIGYTASHGLRLLKTRLLALSPDVLVVAYGINEPARSWDPAARVREPRREVSRSFFYALSASRLFQTALSAYRRSSWFHPPASSVPWSTPQEYAESLRQIVHEGRRREIRVLFLKLGLRPMEMGGNRRAFLASHNPDHFDNWGVADLEGLHRLHDRYQRVLVDVARQERVPIADAQRILRQQRNPPLFGPYDLVHPNVLGARVVAETVQERLRQLGWLGPQTETSADVRWESPDVR